jgi:hypothetical protein
MTCDCDAPDAFRQVMRTARIEHRCCECHATIQPGDPYEYSSGVWDGRGDEQTRLAALFRLLVRRGVHCVLSNSDTPLARELYAGFPIVELTRSGNISCKGNGRQRVGEILVLGGTWVPGRVSVPVVASLCGP